MTIKVREPDGTEVEYSDSDMTNTVELVEAGVYRITRQTAQEGTLKVMANAQWESPLFSVSKHKRYEVIGEFEVE